MNKTKILSFVKTAKYELAISVALLFNLIPLLFKSELISDRFFGALTMDTHFGVHTVTLIGSILKIIFGYHPTRTEVTVFQFLALILGYILVAVFCGGAIRKSNLKNKEGLCCLVIFISAIHTGFADFSQLFELFDIYWLIGIMLSLFFAKNDITRFFVPLFAVTSLWANSGFLVAYMPIVYIMCIYFFIRKKTATGAAQLVFMVIVTVAGTVWFFLSARYFTEISSEDILSYIKNKTGVSNSDVATYIIHHFTDMSDNNVYDMEPFYEAVNNKYNAFTIMLGYIYVVFRIVPFTQLVIYIFLTLPFVIFFERIWKKSIAFAGNKSEKFVYILCMLTPLVQYFAMLLSSDTSRMSAHLIITQLLLVLLFTKDNNNAVDCALGDTLAIVKKHYPVVICLAAVYAAFLFRW